MLRLLKKISPSFFLQWYHFGWAFFGAVRYGFPSRKLTVIGVTGTDGKSTTVEMITRVLRESGASVASTSSVWFQIGDRKWKNTLKMGMPGRFFLQWFLAQAVREGCQYAVIEVSSEGILQHRHRFINFHTAVFTNLSPEHIERHGSFERYRNEKLKLFRAAKYVHVINGDDENAEHFLRMPAKETYVYGVQASMLVAGNVETKTLFTKNIRDTKDGAHFSVEGTEIRLRLPGPFNAYNALAALCVGLSRGLTMEQGKSALEQMPGMPGRMERVMQEPYTVIIDYAVTPKALEGLYRALRELYEPKRMICVLGACGGGRDRWKRPVLGEIAARYCDQIILTDEDPYGENPEAILEEIASGFSHIPHSTFQIPKYEKILDRRDAIRRALSMAEEGDLVVMTGKGSEDAIARAGGEKVPWDERKVAEEELAKLRGT